MLAIMILEVLSLSKWNGTQFRLREIKREGRDTQRETKTTWTTCFYPIGKGHRISILEKTSAALQSTRHRTPRSLHNISCQDKDEDLISFQIWPFHFWTLLLSPMSLNGVEMYFLELLNKVSLSHDRLTCAWWVLHPLQPKCINFFK